MNTKMPQKLSFEPLRETIFEIRFEPTISAAGDILPGLLYSAMKSEYPDVTPLPMANVPRGAREKNPELHYQPSHRLKGKSSSVQVGDRVVSLSIMEYPGWTRFRGMLEGLIDVMKGTGFIKRAERFSLKYLNVIEMPATEKQLPLINARVELCGSTPIERGFHLRAELDEGKCITIVQIAPNATAKLLLTNKEVSGLLIDIDTIRFEVGNELWTNRTALLEECHLMAKRTFFSLLANTTLEKLKPVW
jgi:uncharacterized protein (TIGR04255 family)